MYKFDGFSIKAGKALNLAIESARALGHTYIGCEHIVLGLLKEYTCTACNALRDMNITDDRYEKVLKQKLSTGEKSFLSLSDFTDRAQRVLESSLIKSHIHMSSASGTDDILLSVIEEKTSLSYSILKKLHTNFSVLKNRLEEYSYLEHSTKDSLPTKKQRHLESYGVNLNARALEGKIDPIIGREKETKRLIQILSRRTKNNPCLLGDPGVGKTALVEGLALKIVQSQVPYFLLDKVIISLSLTGMVAGTRYRGDLEERIKKTIDEVKSNKNIILFIDEIHSIVGAGSAEGSPDIANIIKPALTNGDIQVIGATTMEEYRRCIAKDVALDRRFLPVNLTEPNGEDTINIIEGIKDRYETFHGVKIPDKAISTAVKLSQRYITDRFLPDKAIDLIDEACSATKISANRKKYERVGQINNKLYQINQQKLLAIREKNSKKIEELNIKEKELNQQLEDYGICNTLSKKYSDEFKPYNIELTPQNIATVVSEWTNIPVETLTSEENDRLQNIEKILSKEVIGQDEAVKTVSNALKRGRIGLRDVKRPIDSFIFMGPTGVGKTKLCKVLAEKMFCNPNSLIRFDMSEFMEKHSVSRLIGSPPGYVGFENGGQLTEKVKKCPYCIVLFDEIEKAHPDVVNILLQILDDGFLTDAKGRKIDFRNTVIVMTSNIGAKVISSEDSLIGFCDNRQTESDKIRFVKEELKKHFNPEFLNRIDHIVIFNKLTSNNMVDITRLLLEELQFHLSEMNISIEFSDNIVEFIAHKERSTIMGARPLKRIIRDNIENKLADEILKNRIRTGEKVVCDYNGEVLLKKLSTVY